MPFGNKHKPFGGIGDAARYRAMLREIEKIKTIESMAAVFADPTEGLGLPLSKCQKMARDLIITFVAARSRCNQNPAPT